VARQLEQFIADGTLPPGERLNEVALSQILGVSRGPVREAARALEKYGLVTVIMNRGAFVRTLTIEEAKDIYEINGVLFGLAAAKAATAPASPDRLKLRAMVDGMDAAILRSARDEFFRMNSEFHALIMSCGGNHEAQALYSQLTRKLQLLRRRSFEEAWHMQAANDEHRALIEAILEGDALCARRLAEAHARSGCARFLESIGHKNKREDSE